MNIKDIDYNKDYYSILGVSKDASQDDIKKAFRKASLKWHPDKHSDDSEKDKKAAEEKFKECNDAYAILSDENLRSAYDAGPVDESFDPFGMAADMFMHHGSSFDEPRPQVININVTYDDICNGINKTIKYNRTVVCKDCNGAGGDKVETCPDCNGQGMQTQTFRDGWSIHRTMTMCPHCHGTGKIIKNPCKTCHGTGLQSAEETIDVKLKTEDLLQDGAGIYMGNRGNMTKDGKAAPLVVLIKHDLPDGMKIVMNAYGTPIIYHAMEVPYYDMLLGTKVQVKVPSGKTIAIKIPENCQEGQMLNAHGQGFLGGDYIIVPKIKMIKPDKKQKELLEEIRKLSTN